MGLYITGSSFRARPTLSSPSTSPSPPLELTPMPSPAGYDLSPGLDSQIPPCLRGEQPSVHASLTNETDTPLTTQIAHVTTRCPVIVNRVRPVPSCSAMHGQPPLFSVSRRSLALDGPSPCLTPTHRTRQRISQHCPSLTSHDASTSRGRPSISPPS
jgi:hypothetical protein